MVRTTNSPSTFQNRQPLAHTSHDLQRQILSIASDTGPVFSRVRMRLARGPTVLMVCRVVRAISGRSRSLSSLLEMRLAPLDADTTGFVIAFKALAPVGSPGTPPVDRVYVMDCIVRQGEIL